MDGEADRATETHRKKKTYEQRGRWSNGKNRALENNRRESNKTTYRRTEADRATESDTEYNRQQAIN